MKRISYAFILLLTCITQAHAYSHDYRNVYVTAGAGGDFAGRNWTFTDQSSTQLFAPTPLGTGLFQMQQVDWDNKYKNGYEANLALGAYYCPDWRFEGELKYQHFKRRIDGYYGAVEVSPGSGDVFTSLIDNSINTKTKDVNTYALLANAYYDFTNYTRFTPFFGAGLGVAWVNSGRALSTNDQLVLADINSGTITTLPAHTHSPALKGATFAWQLKAGLLYEFNCSVAVVAQYNLFATSNFHAGASKIVVNPDTAAETTFTVRTRKVRGMLNHLADVGLRFSF